MKAAILLAVLLLAGCSDKQFPLVVARAEIECSNRGGVQHSYADEMDADYYVATYCNDGTTIKYRIKRTDR